MIRPAVFGSNPETSESNAFQRESDEDPRILQERVEAEFDAAAETLRDKGVDLFVFEDTIYPAKPDAVFPNNWVSFHDDGTVILYPMFAASRRAERRLDIIEGLRSAFEVRETIDLSAAESHGRFLEGTGSMVLDRANAIAYACVSPRTDEQLFHEVCGLLGYKAVMFHARDRGGRAIYHTNVLMSIAEDLTVICLDSISDKGERTAIAASLRKTGHQLIDITFEQMEEFAGNMLALRTNDERYIAALSRRALNALSGQQQTIVERHCELVALDVPTIECAGGGSVRCMIAELFLPRHDSA